MAESLTAEYFEPHIGKRFRIAGKPHELVLTRVERLERYRIEGEARAPFLLILRGAPDNVLADGVYRIEIDDGPSFDAFLNPILTPARDHQNYQIAFN